MQRTKNAFSLFLMVLLLCCIAAVLVCTPMAFHLDQIIDPMDLPTIKRPEAALKLDVSEPYTTNSLQFRHGDALQFSKFNFLAV